MIGWLDPLFKVSALATFPLFANVQAFVLLVSWNLSCPMVRGVSRLTVVPDVMSMVEKSANALAPSAIVPPVQLLGVLHSD